jgi:hypothetical protein
MATFDVGDDALKPGVIGALAAVPVAVGDVNGPRLSMQDDGAERLGQVLPRGVE